MLFLLNDHIVELDVPEAHLNRRWRAIGCGHPNDLRAQDAIEFVARAMSDARRSGKALDMLAIKDFAALIVTKTGANSLILRSRADGSMEPRLQDLPRLVLETYQRGALSSKRSSKLRANL
ncbi:MAG: hypothetical protein AAGJ85_00110 [Pseudomonadota bacterium]